MCSNDVVQICMNIWYRDAIPIVPHTYIRIYNAPRMDYWTVFLPITDAHSRFNTKCNPTRGYTAPWKFLHVFISFSILLYTSRPLVTTGGNEGHEIASSYLQTHIHFYSRAIGLGGLSNEHLWNKQAKRRNLRLKVYHPHMKNYWNQ